MKKKTKSTVSLKKEDIQKLLKRQNSTLERLKRELKIEAALERVRVVAMGMKQSNELLDICEIVYQELQVLGFTELRNAMINIHDDDNGSFLNYDYSDRVGKTITTIFYNSHPSTKNLVKQIKKSNDAFAAIEIKGRELDKWRDYRKSMGEEDDPKLDNTNTLTYYFYSIGAGAIGISTYNPISEEKRKLLKRFRNVFDFAYRRYRDVTQAEVQAREARIETALERVRSRTMAMHQSEELLQVITVVAEQLLLLDYKFDNVSFAVRNQAHDYKFWFSSPGAPKPFFIQVPYINNPMFERVRYIQGENLNLYCDTLTVEENRQWHQHVFENSELQYLPEKRKQYILNMGYARTIAFMPTIMMILGNYSAMPYTVEENKVFKRFAEVFEQSYTRFLDLQKAEAQAREAQIQLALERVRARTMAMQHSDELREAASVLFGQVKELCIEAWTCGYNIWDENRKTVLAWLSRGVMQPAFKIPITENPTLMHFYEAAQRGEALYVEEVGGETLTELYRYLGTLLLSAGISDEVRKPGYSPPTYQVNHTAYFSYGYLLFVTYKPVPEAHPIFKRFAKVFEQTYTRFLDLQKAEAQAKEAQIEAALEKVRSRSLAMHNSSELEQVVGCLFDRLVELGLSFDGALIFVFDKERRNIVLWIATNQLPAPIKIDLPYDIEIENNMIITDLWNAIENGEHLFSKSYSGEIKNDYFRYVAKYNESKIPEPIRQLQIDKESWLTHFVAQKNSILGFDTWSGHITADEDFKILIRFSRVFEQAYTRFLDLQKAEAQARESQIQLALERVRAKTMAMHNSQDVGNTVATMFEQLIQLGVTANRCGIIIFTDTNDIEVWTAKSNPTSDAALIIGYLDVLIHPMLQAVRNAWKNKENFFSYELMGEDIANYYTAINNSPGYPARFNLDRLPSYEIHSDFFFPEGAVFSFTSETLSVETSLIFKRFAGVFGQTYRRYLDLQKAETQAREAKIEASLEKVRGRAMAMHKSDELLEAGSLLYKELLKLGIPSLTSGYVLMDEDERMGWNYGVNPTDGSILPHPVGIPHTESLVMEAIKTSWKKQDPFFVLQLDPEETIKHQTYIAEQSIHFPLSASELIAVTPERLILQSFNFKQGYLLIVGGEVLPLEKLDMVARFAKVFELTYRRFLDLKQAEAQAREAQIEAALERVRSRSMGMQKSEELKEVIRVVYEQFVHLNIHIEHTGFIIDYKERDDMHIWLADRHEVPFQVTIPYFDCAHWNSFIEAKAKGKEFFANQLSFEEKNKFYTDLFKLFPVPEETKEYYFNCPGLAISTVLLDNIGLYIENFSGIPYTVEENNTLMRFGKVFQQTYTRFIDLQKAEAQAREAKIEAALEKVRSRSLAMHKAEELGEVITVVVEKLKELDFSVVDGVALITYTEGSKNLLEWMANPGFPSAIKFHLPYFEHPVLANLWKAKNEGADFVVERYTAEENKSFLEHIFEHSDFKHTPQPVKDYCLAADTYATFIAFQKNTSIFINDYSGYSLSDQEIDILKRFSKVFEQAYIRFLDLQKAEAQAREAQIEASLERVRSKAMSMHSSRDLAETIRAFYQQIEILSAIPRRLGIGIINKETHTVELTTMNSTEKGDSVEIIGTLSLAGHPVLEGIYDNWQTQTEYQPVLKGNELRDYYNIVRPQLPYPDYPSTYAQYGYFFFFPEGGVYAWTEQEMSGDEIQLYRRFTSVLSLTYKRYRDLKEAEAQAREASIQLALERVRARTMAMQSSEELVETSQLLFEEFKKLNLVSLGKYFDRALIGIPDKSHSKVEFWSTDLKGTGINYKFEGSIEEPHLFNRTIHAWKNEEKSIIIDLDGIELASYLDYLKSIGFPVAENHYQRRRIHYFAFFSKGLVGISTTHQLPPETLPLLERFAGVFDLTYTRFLDLQKAEAQVRESKIELALERVRARTMAMQRSDELADAAEVLFKQFAELGNEPDRISIGIIDELSGFTDLWATDQEGRQLKILFKARNTEKTTFKKMVADWKAGKKSTIIDLRDDDLKEWIRYIRNEMGLIIRDEHFNNRRIHQVSFFSQGWLNITTLEPVTDDVLSLLDRFAAVFNLTFTRFLDLKKAEAQTRQAQIETAMEKVRARSLAMQKPEELKEVAQVLRSEMGVLGVEELETCSIYILDETSGKTNCWFAIKSVEGKQRLSSSRGIGTPPVLNNSLVSDYMTIDLRDTWVGRKMAEFYYSDQQQTSILMQGEPRKEWIKYCIDKSTLFDDTIYGENIPDRTYHLNKFSNGYLGAASPGEISAESWELLKRATTVFSLAYTRFSDLQRAEANTREAVKQASMDRVRAEIASMRAPADLEKIIPLLWSELTVLGVPFIRCGVFIMDNPDEQIHTYLSTPDGKALAAFDIPYSTPGNIVRLLNHWRDKKAYLDQWDEEDFKEFAANLVRLGAMSSQEQYLSTLPPGGFYLHFLPFLQGMLYVGNLTALQEDELNLIQSVADAFSTAYARYEDFNNLEAAKLQVDRALVDLKQAQQQLVQSEKMASLGELTAGIAHEIQNPLNFVNNFSEVNTELIDEIKQAVQSGNNEEVLALAENVKQNLEKINFHGKRADGIVKSMLQHSRTSDQGGKNLKEPTDINVLAEEYLRLAYHGLRAKDKAFNATLKTDFDESIGLIQVMGQDIARAILNLITNAFYAVQEKQRQGVSSSRGIGTPPVLENYQPIVSITTKKTSDSTIEISVKDNGPGIPQNVLDKIFQPFFTTKPTGQGTGLGLSLCYDIVKAHRGELKVKTAVGEGSEFIIQLPV